MQFSNIAAQLFGLIDFFHEQLMTAVFVPPGFRRPFSAGDNSPFACLSNNSAMSFDVAMSAAIYLFGQGGETSRDFSKNYPFVLEH